MKHYRFSLALLVGALTLLSGPVHAQPPAGDPLGPDVYRAISNKDTALLKALLAKGAKVEQTNWLGVTPLHWASITGNQEACEVLLAQGANIKHDIFFGTALELAQMSPNPKLPDFLVAHGAVPSKQRVDKISALMLAAEQGNTQQMATYVRAKLPIDATDVTGSTALAYASQKGRLDAVRFLLERGAQPDKADQEGQTALHVATKNGHPEIVKLLLAHRSNPNARDKRGATPLLLAVRYSGDPEVVRALLRAGAERHGHDPSGRSAWELAQQHGFTECASLLAPRGRPRETGAPLPLPLTQQARKAVERSLPLLERTTRSFTKVVECASCHHQGLGLATTGMAKSLGYFVDPELAKQQQALVTKEFEKALPQVRGILPQPELYKMLPTVDLSEYSPATATTLFGLAAQGVAPSEVTEAMAVVLAHQQSPDGAWRFVLHREPLQSSPFMTTAYALRALNTYLPLSKAPEYKERLDNARRWLVGTPAHSNEDMTFRLLGLRWAGAPESEIAAASQQLRLAQKRDGGWAQFTGPTSEGAAYSRSDAYATGQALYALKEGGRMTARDACYQRGVRYLIRTQDSDGSWFVSKRAIPVNTYFDTGFPHGKSQYISYSATCWAVMALMGA